MRDLLAGDDPAARTLPVRAEQAERVLQTPSSWRPGSDLDRHVPQHVGPQHGGPVSRRWRDRLRWDPGRKGAAALGAAVVAAVAATGWWLAASRPHEVPISATAGSAPVSASSSGSGSGSGSSASGSAAAQPGSTSMSAAPSPVATGPPVVVDVAGKVRRPGIYTLAAGARVYDAVRAAGGVKRGVSTQTLNLAAPLRDGQQVVVGAAAVPGSIGADGTHGGATGSSGPVTVVDLNTATLEQLETLPGVGPVLGQHILDWRAAHGQFASVDQLREVSGIGDVRFAQLRPLVTT